MKCSKRKVIVLLAVAVVLVLAFSASFLFFPWGKNDETKLTTVKRCTSDDCFSVADKVNIHVRQRSSSPSAATKLSSISRKMCTSQECVLQAAKILRWMDTRWDPCEDFYNFSCGNFMSTHALPDGWTSFGVHDLASEEIALAIKSILDKEDKYEENDALKRVKKLYRTCLNTSHIEEHSVEHLKDVLSGKWIGEWPFMKTEWNDCRLDMEWRMAKLNALGIDSFVRLEVDFRGDDHHAFAYMTVAPPLVDHMCEGDDSNASIALVKASKHIEIVETVLSLLQVQNNNTREDIEDMFIFDFMFCNATKLSREEGDPRALNQTLQDLINVAPEINWGRWRNIIFSELGLHFPHDKFNIYVHGVNNSIDSIVNLVHNTSSRTLANYLTWKFVFHHLGFLGEPFRRVIENHRNLFASSLSQFMDSDRWIPRWQQCIYYTEELMPVALLPPFLTRILTPDVQREMAYVVSAMKNGFRDIFRKSSSLQRDEKVISIHKIDQVDVQLFYPDKEKKFFDKYYFEMGSLGDSFIKNGLKAKMNQMRKLMEGIFSMKNYLDLEYAMTTWNPFAVDAWSAFLGNKIVIFLGELGSAQISSKLPRFISMSTLGATIGEELARGFDLEGISNWGPSPYNWTRWPDYVVRYVEQKALCHIETSIDTSQHSEKWNSLRIVKDDLVDNQGVYLAYKAYISYVSNFAEERYLPGLSFTNEQLFFIRYAQARCELSSAENASRKSARQRTNGVLKNMIPFSEAFRCAKEDTMNPSKKCEQLWL